MKIKMKHFIAFCCYCFISYRFLVSFTVKMQRQMESGGSQTVITPGSWMAGYAAGINPKGGITTCGKAAPEARAASATNHHDMESIPGNLAVSKNG